MAHGSRVAAVLGALACLVTAAACTADSGRDIVGLENSTATTLEPYVEPHFDDTRGVALQPVPPGAPLAFPVTVEGGSGTISGTLTGPDGPVSRGRVRLERFVGQSSASVEVATNGQGQWVAKGIVGGRYRVRGWRRPDLAMNASTLLFLDAEVPQEVALAATVQGGVDIQAALLTTTPTIDRSVTVAALITRHEVDQNGVVQGIALTGTVATLSAPGGWDIAAPDAVVDGAGGVRWTVTCTNLGPPALMVTADGSSTTIPAPRCNRPAGPVTTVEIPEEPVADFPIGDQFTPPFAGPLPAGAYRVVDTAESCALIFEIWEDGDWSEDRVTVTGTEPLVLDSFARNIETLGTAPACTYERTA